MKKKKIIIVSILVLVVVLLVLGVVVFKNNKSKNEQTSLETSEKEHYKKMYERMYDYYKIVYSEMELPEDKKTKPIRINLGVLKRKGYPMDEFINYETKEECDLTKSYAVRTFEDEKYKINVYYLCGNKANYTMNTNTTTTTTKTN